MYVYEVSPPKNVFNALLRVYFFLECGVPCVINLVANHLYHEIGMRKELLKMPLLFV